MNGTGYYEKIVISNSIIEVWQYEKLNVKSGGKREKGEGIEKEHNYKNQMRRRRNAIRQLICTNFDSNSKFVTLTFNDAQSFDITNVKACNAYFKNFIKRLKYYYPGLKYVTVIEFQDANGRGAVHYHMICNLPYVANSELASIWGAGFIKINNIEQVDNVGAYVIKYMCTDMGDTRLMGLQAYLHSRNLTQPKEYKSWEKTPDYIQWRDISNDLAELTPCFEHEYASDYSGSIIYKQFNLNRG